MKNFYPLFSLALIFGTLTCSAQKDSARITLADHHQATAPIDSARQRDLIDVFVKLFHLSDSPDERQAAKKASFSGIPSASYSLTTGFQADFSSNVGFYTTKGHSENYSAISSDLTIDTKKQKVALFRGDIWFAGNQYKMVTDTRWERFPEDTYGLGTLTTADRANSIDFKYVRNYITLYKKITGDFYAGAGYNLDYHYGISQGGNLDHTVSDFNRYGFSTASTSSGFNLDLSFDNRRNIINPLDGGFVNVVFRDNPVALGSNSNWQSLQFDLRRYIRLSPNNNNVLALWSILWFTHGNVPYLDLPGTGQDMFNNSGRGYIQGRFLGRNMLYFESEYRFGITSNGLLGAVVFANAQSLSEYPGDEFKKIAPAAGGGLRIKINKHSNTNICIDYAVGIYKSNGLFLNLGEIF